MDSHRRALEAAVLAMGRQRLTRPARSQLADPKRRRQEDGSGRAGWSFLESGIDCSRQRTVSLFAAIRTVAQISGESHKPIRWERSAGLLRRRAVTASAPPGRDSSEGTVGVRLG